MTVLGAGLLCGTALAVIVPEGVHALYEEVLEGERDQPYLRHVGGRIRGISSGYSVCLSRKGV